MGLTRANLQERTLATLSRGSWSSPDVLLVEAAGGRAVVKDFSPRAWWVRALLGRWLLRREASVHRALADHPSVPRLLGRIDSHALVLEHRAGSRFSGRRPGTFSPEFVAELRAAVAGLHARGVVHLDLGHRSNVLADPAGRPVLVDFDAALRFRRGGLGERWLMPWLRRFDERAVAKWAAAAAAAAPPAAPGSRASEPRRRGAGPQGASSEGGRGARRPM